MGNMGYRARDLGIANSEIGTWNSEFGVRNSEKDVISGSVRWVTIAIELYDWEDEGLDDQELILESGRGLRARFVLHSVHS